MQIRSLINLIALLSAITPIDAIPANADDLFKSRIVGTWRGEYQWQDRRHPESWIKARSEDHYQDNRHVAGTVDYTYPDREAHVRYEARWDVQDGYLVIEVTRSTGSYLKTGTKTRDKIVSLSDRKMELQTEGGEIITLRRSD